jgi:hypothetical protein
MTWRQLFANFSHFKTPYEQGLSPALSGMMAKFIFRLQSGLVVLGMEANTNQIRR